MKNTLVFLLSATIFFTCKKKEDVPQPEPEPVKTGNISVTAMPYDTLGEPLTDGSGVRVRLNSSLTATTSASGKVSFENVAYDTYFPELFKDGWDGGIAMLVLNSPSKEISLPITKRSPFRLQNLTANVINQDSVTISFNLDRIVPAGKKCKVAVITSTLSGLNGNSYDAANIVEVTSPNTAGLNIMRLDKIRNYLLTTAADKTIYLNAIPVSYGEFDNTLTPKPVLLGENLFTPTTITIKRNWNKN